jgi:hypothetical protein
MTVLLTIAALSALSWLSRRLHRRRWARRELSRILAAHHR